MTRLHNGFLAFSVDGSKTYQQFPLIIPQQRQQREGQTTNEQKGRKKVAVDPFIHTPIRPLLFCPFNF
jgi:hypothetical protein